MSTLLNFMQYTRSLKHKTGKADFLAPLLLRLYLAPVFWVAANNKWNPFDSNSSLDSVIQWLCCWRCFLSAAAATSAPITGSTDAGNKTLNL